jgi:hypothetical protein
MEGGQMERLVSRVRVAAVSLVVALISLTGIAVVDVDPASAASGCNHDLCIATPYFDNPTYTLSTTVSPTFTGWYHVHIWLAHNTVEDYNTPDQRLVGGEIYGNSINLRNTEIGSVHRGETICGELWWWNHGHWESRGLPCITH